MVRVLLVEDDRGLRTALVDTLTLADIDCQAVGSGEEALQAIGQGGFSLVISDVNMPGMDGHALLAALRRDHPLVPVLLMTAHATVDRAVLAMRQGAVDYLVKPFAPRTLTERVRLHAAGQWVGEEDPVAVDPSSRQLLALAARVAQSDSTVMITGESGTGKEVLARYLHRHSARAQAPFVAINCAAIPDNMLEATLFGHEKGAFTGAVAAQPGKFELAQGGTLLLDEVSEMPLALQAKLLRVLQEREVERVGGRKPITLDIRVLATSNRALAQEVAAGRFREDLFYRLSVFPLTWTALRDRPADIVPLAERLLARHAAKMQRPAVQLSATARRYLQAHTWPGNVRELDNAMQRALILQQGGVIEPADFCLSGDAPPGSGAAGGMPGSVPGAADLPSAPTALNDDLRRHEYARITEALRAERGKRKEAAERLGISARTLRYKLAQMREDGWDASLD